MDALPGRKMKRRSKATIYQGFAVSLALHSALALPFVPLDEASPPEEPATLIIELEGVVADSQVEEKILQTTKAEATRDKADASKPEEISLPPEAPSAQEQPAAVTNEPPPVPPELTRPPAPSEEPSDAAAEPPPVRPEPTRTPVRPDEPGPPPTAMKSENASANDLKGAEERRDARTISTERETEADRLRNYARELTKKVRAHLVYPDEARKSGSQGIATVSFTILSSGQIQPETLKITVSSGQPKLDASALKTVRLSVPFGPPPREMTVSIAVAFGREP